MVNGPGEGDLERPVGVAPQLGDDVDLDGGAAPDRSDHPRNGDGRPRAVDGLSGAVDVDAVERGREAVRVALAADLAVGDDVESDALLLVHGEGDGVPLGFGEVLLVDPPQVVGADPHGQVAVESLPVDQPRRLGPAADERGGQDRERHRRRSIRHGVAVGLARHRCDCNASGLPGGAAAG